MTTYTGGTTVNNGSTLIGSTDAVIGNIADNGSLKFSAGSLGGYNVNSGLQDVAGTYSGVVTGIGSVEITGTTPVTLSGLNQYTGNTTIDHGSTLIGTTDSVIGNITDSGSLKLSAGTQGGYNVVSGLQDLAGMYSGNISGIGHVEISGTGPVTFTGTSTYLGGTTIDSGSSLIGTTNSLQGAITNSGALEFTQSTSGTYSGIISGTGSVEIGGTGPISFTGSNTYSGGTTVDVGGALNGTTTSLQGSITDNGSVLLNQSTAGTYAGNLSGTG